jgi:septal ring factor EnvC (AmiA/AmiB activator)
MDALLRQLADAQRGLGEQMQELRERVDALHTYLAERNDEDDGLDQDVKALRDEVKGLYVENSTLKQQIDSLREDVGGVNSNVSAFRTFAGFFLAIMILLLVAVVFVLTIRR